MNEQQQDGSWLRRDTDWIQAALHLMSGEAHAWALPTLEEIRDGSDPFRGYWREFEKEFSRRFIPLDPAEAARDTLKHLKQGKRSVAEYKARFDEQAPLTKWSQVDLRTRFYDGLNDQIKDTLAITDRPVVTLRELVESANIIDTRIRQRSAEKKGKTFHQTSSQDQGVVSMEVDATQTRPQGKGKQGKGKQGQTTGNPPSSSGKNRASFLKDMAGKCFGCGSTDHTKKNGNHERKICHWCQRTGHRANVCFSKYMGQEKKQKAAGTSQPAPSTSTDSAVPQASAAASSSPEKIIKQLLAQN